MAFTADVTWYFIDEIESDGSIPLHGHMQDFESEYDALAYLSDALAWYSELDTDAKLAWVSVFNTETHQFTYSYEFY